MDTMIAGRMHNRRAVYVESEKKLFIFWISAEAGWVLGYEEGMETGGAFYSSGASPDDQDDLLTEPWLGSWRDDQIRVECSDFDEEIPILRPHQKNLLSEGLTCEDNYECVPREECPEHEDVFKKLQTLNKSDKEAKNIIKQLRKKVIVEHVI